MKKIKLLATGGTIAAKVDKEKGGAVQALSGKDLISVVPGLKEIAIVEVETVLNVPGGHITPQDWLILLKSVNSALEQNDIDGIIITHGTDTIEETAYFLDLVIDNSKPIVITGAQRNASIFDTDGPRNILEAAKTVVSPEATNKGVMVVFNSEIHAARDVSKTHTLAPQTFQSNNYGMIGEVIGDKVNFYRQPLKRYKLPIKNELSRVDIIAMYAGADGSLVEAAVKSGARGIVIQGLGAGNINPPMYHAITKAIEQKVVVVISTRVPRGSLMPIYGWLGGGVTTTEIGVILAGDLSPQKARILLMVSLAGEKTVEGIRELFSN